MNISSETITDVHSDPQLSRMRVMIPNVQRQHGILLVRTGQQKDVEYAGQGYIPRNINNNQQANCINLHGNANTNVKILNKTATDVNDDDKNDNPIDLSSTSTISSSTVKTKQNKEVSGNNSLKLQATNIETKNTDDSETEKPSTYKIGKRKHSSVCEKTSENADLVDNNNKRNIESWVGHVKPVPGIPRQAGSKREEVLKAARSLFSKRTRTLYHWLCPSTSKTKLKSTVAAAWDTLSTGEKDFYISQVLGRFGVPACSLMVNPQLGGLKTDGKPGTTSSSTGTSTNMEETRRAVTSLLLNENDVAWSPYTQRQNDDLPRKKRKNHQTYKLGETPNNKETIKQHPEEEETLILKEIHEASLDEDFADDPELNIEFEQFRNLIDVELAKLGFNDALDGI